MKMKKGTLAVLATALGAAAGAAITGRAAEKSIGKKAEKVDKFKSYYNMLNQWLIIKQEGRTLEKYFLDNGYRTIAIYGMGEMGNRLYDELKDSSIEVKYAIDKNADSTYAEIEVMGLEDDLAEVDAVVVTAVFAFNTIEDELTDKLLFPLISLEDVIYDS